MDRADLIVIGGGSGGLAAARRAALHGKRVYVVEERELGGTCVNRGCVPKKVWHDTAALVEAARDELPVLGILDEAPPYPDWAALRAKIEAYILRLNGIYGRNLEREGVELVQGRARLAGPGQVAVGDRQLHGDAILIATGGRPRKIPIPGAELMLTSDEFFQLDAVPARTCVVGGGYIGVELAGVLHAFGSQVTIVEFLDRLLPPMDAEIAAKVLELYGQLGIRVHLGAGAQRVESVDGGQRVTVAPRDRSEPFSEDFDAVICAVGRAPNVEELGLEEAGVELDERGFIKVDEAEQTTAAGVYAIGDIIARPALTPVAIKAGRRLADRLYGGATKLMDYDHVATAVFAPVELGMIGLTEEQARARYGDDAVKVYRSGFKPMRKTLFPDTPIRSFVKMVVAGPDEQVVGLHIMSPEAAEIIQGYAVAVTAGLTKAHFDDALAIHPTISEELVTLR